MSWTPAKQTQPTDFFKPASEVLKKHRKGLKVGVFGPYGSGKTHFALTFPEPIYVLDTEFGAAPVARKFDKKIYIYEACVIDPTTDTYDAIESLERFETAVTSIKDVDRGTIVIDTGTDLWSWLGTWKDSVGKIRSKKSGELLRVEWSHANERYRNLIMKLLARPTHFVMTGHVARVFDEHGQEITYKSPEPHWMKKTPHWLDIILYLAKETPKQAGATRYVASISKCRWERALDINIEDVTFDKLCKSLEEQLMMKVVE